MLFNSYIFILLFLPLSICGYYLLQKASSAILAKLFLIGMSMWFYGYFNPRYLFVILISICCNYLLSRWMISASEYRCRVFTLSKL